jgi:hypothetical protein
VRIDVIGANPKAKSVEAKPPSPDKYRIFKTLKTGAGHSTPFAPHRTNADADKAAVREVPPVFSAVHYRLSLTERQRFSGIAIWLQWNFCQKTH